MAISNAAAISYTLTSSDEGQYIAFAVTPADGTDSGSTVFSSYVGPIAAAANDIDLCSGETAPSLSNITVANGEIKYCNVTGVITLASNVVCEAGGTLELIGASIQVNSGGLTAKSGCTMTLSTQ
jgi:hypothetical protein